MTTRAVVGEGCMTGGNLAGAKKLLAAAHLKKHDGCDPADNGEKAHPVACAAPRMLFAIITEVAFVALCNLLLRSARRSHFSIIEEGHERMPGREHEQQKREGHVDEQPPVQPVVQSRLKIEHSALVAPRLNFFDAAAIAFRYSKFHKSECVVRIATAAQTKFFAPFRAEIRNYLPLEKLSQRGFRFRIAGGRSWFR